MSFSSVFSRSWTLPQWVTEQNKWLFFVATAFVSCVLYLSSNYYPIREPSTLPLTYVDHLIPVMPWSVWFYLSEYFLFILAVLWCKDMNRLNRFFFAFATLQISSVIFFCLFPTTFPREAFAVPEAVTVLQTYSLNMLLHLREVDAPNNCLPSLHVASCIMFTMIYFGQSKKKFTFFAIWTFLISLSTLTTKQHYLADVLVGAVVSLAIYWLFFEKMQYEEGVNS